MHFKAYEIDTWKKFVPFSFVLILMYSTSFYNYLLFHSLSELFSIAIAFGIFMFAWNSRTFAQNNYIIFLGIAYLFVGGLDMLHMLSYKGMGIFEDDGGNLPTQLWISARYMESGTLLIAPFLIKKNIKTEQIFFWYVLIVSICLFSVFYWGIFPECFTEDIGLTPFKKWSEYIICLMLFGSLYLLYQKRKEFDPSVFLLLCISITLTVLSELAFTFYISVYGFSNLVGHIFKIISYYLIYKAIIYTGLKTPYNLLFKEISDREYRYRQMFETNSAIKLIINSETGAIEDANSAACDFYGYTRERLLSLNITDINALPPNEVTENMAAAKEKKALCFTFPHRLASGEITDVEVYTGPITFGQKTYLYSIIHDVSRRKKAETERDRLFSAIDQAGELIAITSVDGMIQYVNPSFEKITGYKKIEAIGKNPRFLKSGHHSDFVYENLWKTITSGEQWNGQLVNKRKDGQLYTSECSITPVKREEGIIENYIWIAKDITKELELEKRLQQSQKMESIGTLAGGIAHDFNNILTSIIGFGQIALERAEKETEMEDDLQEILSAGMRAKKLVKQILAFARKADSQVEPVKINQIAKEVYNFIRSSIPTTIDIELNLCSSAMVLADPTQIHQIFMNLCTNASHAMEMDGGVLKIDTSDVHLDHQFVRWHHEIAAGDYAKIMVSDTGCGIPTNHINSVFEPYFSTKTAGEGTGLGLSVVHGIVKSIGGEIFVESEIKKGTVFTIYLPVTGKKKSVNQKKIPELPSGTERILVVDDETAIAKMIRRMLDGHGYRVSTKNSSHAALKCFTETPDQFDLVITDMTMPKMTGDVLADEILKIRPDMPIILCTGFSKKINKENAKKLGISAYLNKPIDSSELLMTIRQVLDS